MGRENRQADGVSGTGLGLGWMGCPTPGPDVYILTSRRLATGVMRYGCVNRRGRWSQPCISRCCRGTMLCYWGRYCDNSMAGSNISEAERKWEIESGFQLEVGQ